MNCISQDFLIASDRNPTQSKLSKNWRLLAYIRKDRVKRDSNGININGCPLSQDFLCGSLSLASGLHNEYWLCVMYILGEAWQAALGLHHLLLATPEDKKRNLIFPAFVQKIFREGLIGLAQVICSSWVYHMVREKVILVGLTWIMFLYL